MSKSNKVIFNFYDDSDNSAIMSKSNKVIFNLYDDSINGAYVEYRRPECPKSPEMPVFGVVNIVLQSIEYPENQEAIKNDEIAIIKWKLTSDYDELISGIGENSYTVYPGDLELVSFTACGDTATAVVKRGTVELQINEINFRLVLNGTATRAQRQSRVAVNVAHTTPAITDINPYVIRGGVTTPVPTNFNQLVYVTQVYLDPTLGTIDTGNLPVESVNYIERNILVELDDVLSYDPIPFDFTVRSLSGQEVTLTRQFIVNGFDNYTLTFTWPESEVTIPWLISELEDIRISSATINSIPPLELFMNRVDTFNDMMTLEDYVIINDNGTSKLVINYDQLVQFGYRVDTTITINIEEL